MGANVSSAACPIHTVLWVGGVPAAAAEELSSAYGVESWEYEARVDHSGPHALLPLFELAPRSEDDAFQMYFTSGTTGRPKAVLLTHKARRCICA